MSSLLLAAIACGACGCTLIQQGWTALTGDDQVKSAATATQNTVLKPIAAARNSIQVEVIFVERPADDPLLGDSLWRDLDQVGAVDLAVREGLKRNGFRIGIASSSLPQSLQTLLGLSLEIPDGGGAEDSKRLVGRRVALTSGAETEVQTSPLYSTCTVSAWNGADDETTDFQNARCLFRLKAQRVQDGWAKLEFIPEVHHGDNRVRHTATEAGWELKTSQQVVPFFSQKFELTLNQGELAVIASTGDQSKSLGRHFFIGNERGENVKRVLIVRLADMGQTKPVYQK